MRVIKRMLHLRGVSPKQEQWDASIIITNMSVVGKVRYLTPYLTEKVFTLQLLLLVCLFTLEAAFKIYRYVYM